MIYNALLLAVIAAASLIITLPFRIGANKEFWKWWDSIGVCIFIFDCAVLSLLAIWEGWFLGI
ncbi:MAG: hypothetical protein ACLQAH_16725 [Limisphaerales bacterium]